MRRGKEQRAKGLSAKEIVWRARAQVVSGGWDTQGHGLSGLVRILAL